MNQSTNPRRARPIFWAGLVPVLLSTALIGPFEATAQARPAPAAPQPIRIALPAQDEAALAAARRRIAVAARSLCGSAGVAGVYGNAARRCRDAVRADAERQLHARLTAASAVPGAAAPASGR